MSKFYIKRPDGQIVAAPQHMTKTAAVDGNVETTFIASALKPGWSLATAEEWAAKNKKGG
jgi:hypothetical protein